MTLDDKSSLPELVVKVKEIGRQASSKGEIETAETIGKSITASSIFVTLLYTLGMFLAQASLKYLWDALNSQQVVV